MTKLIHNSAALKVDRTLYGSIFIARITVSMFFLVFCESKLLNPSFVHGRFQVYLQNYISHDAVSLYRPVLTTLVLPHAVFFGYLVGGVELLIGLSLLLGLWVRPLSLVGAIHMMSLTLATWWANGRNVPIGNYFSAQLDHVPLLLLLVIFYAADAGRVWGLDRWKATRQSREQDCPLQPS